MAGCANTANDGPVGAATAPAQTPGQPPDHADSPAAKVGFRELTKAELEERVTPHLQPGETLAHPVFSGPWGPGSDTAVVVFERDQAVAAFAVVTRADGTHERVALPDMSQGMLDEVTAVAFLEADERPGAEVVILTRQMTGIGPEGAIPQPFHVVVAWDGQAFQRLEDVEAAIYDKTTVDDIRRVLDERRRR